MPVTANDFLTSRGGATHNLDYTPGTLALSSQIGTTYQPYLVSGDTNQSFTLNSDTVPTGIPATSRFFLYSGWFYIAPGAPPQGVFFPYQNNATPGIMISAFSSGLVRIIDASFNTAILDYGFDASGAIISPGLNHLLVSCDTIGETYEAVVNGITLAPSGAPHNVTTSFNCDNSGGLYLIQPDIPADTFTEIWFDFPNAYISASSALAHFYSGGQPVDPGVNGSLPYNSIPVGYFTVRDVIPPPPPVPGLLPPLIPTAQQRNIPSYLYEQYNDDAALQTWVNAQNVCAQEWLDWFNQINLPIYVNLSGALLDWVGAGLYGYPRPVLNTTVTTYAAGYNTTPYNTLAYNEELAINSNVLVPVNDDIYKRMLTWHLWKGDGFQYTTRWLKQRIHRFLNGANGVLLINDNTDDVSITSSGTSVTITLTDTPISEIFQIAINDGVLALPFQFSYTVNLV